uniref:Amino acid transporter transmembrane domain-containing protein n=1 Tax=Pyrodinium bahamense TaxID=73915 RepID=A0A7S0AEM5_9DINO
MAAMLHRPDAEDESVRDLRRAIQAQVPSCSDAVRRASTPPEQRARSQLLDPEIGRLRDVAQPGGFRRQHMRQQGASSFPGHYIHSSLVSLLTPDLRSFLESDPGEEQSGCSPEGAVQDPHAVAADGSSSNIATGIILAKCCFGSAVLIVPQGYRNAGLIGAPGTLIFVYIFLLFGMLKLIESRQAWGQPARFGDLGAALGAWGKGYITLVTCILTFGFNCIWCVTCQKNLLMLFKDWGPTARLWLPFPFVALLSLVRRLRVFTITNLVGILLCLTTCIYLTYFAVDELATSGAKPAILINTEEPGDTLLWVGTCGYIFELICQVLPIYEAAEHKDMVPTLLIGVTAAVLVLYLAFGFLFYSAFGKNTADLATLNIPHGSPGGVVFPLLFSIVGVVTMPLNLFVIFQNYELRYSWSQTYLVRKWKKNVVRILVCITTYVVTWAGGEQLQNFLALVGGLLGCNLALCVPAMLHLAICRPRGCARVLDIATFIVGLTIMIVSTYQSFATWGKK